MLLCAISQAMYFAASYTGSLERVLAKIKLSPNCASYCRKRAIIYTSLAWILLFLNSALILYSMFFTGGYMNIMLEPILMYVNVSNLLVPRVVIFVLYIYLSAAWIFPHATTLMFATVFSRQYEQLDQILLKEPISDSDELRMSDSEIETLRRHHQEISISVKKADKFLMFSNAGAFCCQLFGTILLLYALIIYYSTMLDPIVFIKRALWMLGQSFGLSVTAAAGIMVNHYVSTNVYVFTVLFGFRHCQEHLHTTLGTLQAMIYSSIIIDSRMQATDF